MTSITINSELKDIIKKYNPVVYLHDDEHHYPSTPDYYLKNSDLRVKINETYSYYTSPTQEELYDITQKFKTHEKHLIPKGEIKRIIKGNQTLSTPTYVLVQEFKDTYHLIYLYFYTYNGSYNILYITDVGSHFSDIEHFTVEIDKKDLSLKKFYFGAHGRADGQWCLPDQVEYENDRPVAYSAYHGHGLYKKEGVSLRFPLGLIGNDFTKKGYKWDPDIVYIEPDTSDTFDKETMGWVYYNGNWAPDGIAGVVLKGWYNTDIQSSLNISTIKTTYWYLYIFIVFLVLVGIVFLFYLFIKFLFVRRNRKKVN